MPKIAATPEFVNKLHPAAAARAARRRRRAAVPAATPPPAPSRRLQAGRADAADDAGAGARRRRSGLAPSPSLRAAWRASSTRRWCCSASARSPALVGAVFLAQTGQHHPLQSETALRVYAFVFYGIYFVGFWSRARPDAADADLAHPRSSPSTASRLGQGRALVRYVACWIWFAPARAARGGCCTGALAEPGAPLRAWIVVYALLALLHPQRQFWHDALCGTRLVDASGADAVAPAASAPRPRPRWSRRCGCAPRSRSR